MAYISSKKVEFRKLYQILTVVPKIRKQVTNMINKVQIIDSDNSSIDTTVDLYSRQQ